MDQWWYRCLHPLGSSFSSNTWPELHWLWERVHVPSVSYHSSSLHHLLLHRAPVYGCAGLNWGRVQLPLTQATYPPFLQQLLSLLSHSQELLQSIVPFLKVIHTLSISLGPFSEVKDSSSSSFSDLRAPHSACFWGGGWIFHAGSTRPYGCTKNPFPLLNPLQTLTLVYSLHLVLTHPKLLAPSHPCWDEAPHRSHSGSPKATPPP